MNITQESTGKLTATIKLEISAEDYLQQVTKRLKEQQRNANFPGFRPGKVPLGMVKKMYGKAILADEVNQLLSEGVSDYLAENKINILGNPLPGKDRQNEADFDREGDMTFYFDIGFAPEFDLKLDGSFPVDYYKIEADDKLVDEQIKSVRHRMGSHSHPGNIGPGDLVEVEFRELDDDNAEKAGGLNEKKMLDLSTIKTAGIREKFLGLAPGEKVVIETGSYEGAGEDLAYLLNLEKENTGDFKSPVEFTIGEIHRNEPAEMNEELFKRSFGEECDTEEKFREKVRESINASLVPESDKLFVNHAITKLVDEVNIELPEEFLKRLILENDNQGITEEEVDKQFDGYVKSLRWQLIEGKISREKNIRVEENEIRNVVKGYFLSQLPVQQDDEESNNRLNSIVDSVLKSEEERSNIHDRLYETKIKDALKASLKLDEKVVSYDEFVDIARESNKKA